MLDPLYDRVKNLNDKLDGSTVKKLLKDHIASLDPCACAVYGGQNDYHDTQSIKMVKDICDKSFDHELEQLNSAKPQTDQEKKEINQLKKEITQTKQVVDKYWDQLKEKVQN